MRIYKSILLVFILSCLMAPALQFKLNYFTLKELDGDVHLAKDTILTPDSWLDSEWQNKEEKYLNDNFGFRNFYVRLRNQIYYSFFNKVTAKDVVVGKSGFLYELKYLQTHAGIDYVGQKHIDDLFYKLKFIQDTLAKKGIKFALLFAPGKSTFYSEYIPSPYDVTTTETNYLKYTEAAKKSGINNIDFNKWFTLLKPTTKYPLYPQTGTHWSIYAMHLAFDSVLKYLEHKPDKILKNFNYNKVEMSYELRHPDGDIAAGLNLLRELPHFEMAYPDLVWTDTLNRYQPHVLTVSDSYWMGVYFTGLPEKSFSKHEFWYYNKMLYNYNPQGKTGDVTDFDLKKSIEKNDAVFIMSTEASLKNLGWGFVDEVYNLYKYGPVAYYNSKVNRKKVSEINQIKSVIWNDERWFNQTKKQAKEINISFDSCVNINAEFYYNEKHKNDPPPPKKTRAEEIEEKINLVKAQISENKQWYNYLTEKAKKLKISVDSCINMDAQWTAEKLFFEERVAIIKKQISVNPEWLKEIKKKSISWKLPLDSCITIDAIYMAEEEKKKSK